MQVKVRKVSGEGIKNVHLLNIFYILDYITMLAFEIALDLNDILKR